MNVRNALVALALTGFAGAALAAAPQASSKPAAPATKPAAAAAPAKKIARHAKSHHDAKAKSGTTTAAKSDPAKS